MIQVYLENNTNFNRNGDMVLFPEEATTESQLGGSWSASLSHPIDPDGRWKYLTEEAVVKMPSHNGEQLYRIKRREKTDYSVDVEMQPIFFDSADDAFLPDVRPTNMTGQEAIEYLCQVNPKYSGQSDITELRTAYYEYKNLMEAISGDDDNSFLNRWGGEVEYDNFTVKIMQRLGADRGVEIRYGKNIPPDGVKETVDMNGVITRIYPVAYNGRKLSTRHVDALNIGAYPVVKSAVIEYPSIVLAADAGSGDMDDPAIVVCNTQIELDAALTEAANQDFFAGLCYPSVSLSVDMILVGQTEQYSEYKALEEVHLGDTVHLYHQRLGIMTTERVTAITYDSINDRIKSVTLGAADDSYFENLTKVTSRVIKSTNRDGSLKADMIAGVISDYAKITALTKDISTGVKAYRLGPIVILDLHLSVSSGTLSWTVPAGYRPGTAAAFAVSGQSANAKLSIGTDGAVSVAVSGTLEVNDTIVYYTADTMPSAGGTA